MSTDVAVYNTANLAEGIEKILITGDLKPLSPEARVQYYNAVCTSLGLNPLTRPFDYLNLNNKLVLYARKDCADQLRRLYGVSVVPPLVSRTVDNVYIVEATVKDATGRTDIGTGAVNIASLKGENLANAIMKAETKAKRRATLSLIGLGMLDETEIETIRDARKVKVSDGGEIIETNGTERDYAGADVPPIERPSPDFRQSIVDDPLGIGDDSIAEIAANTPVSTEGVGNHKGQMIHKKAAAKGWHEEELRWHMQQMYGKTSAAALTPDEWSELFNKTLSDGDTLAIARKAMNGVEAGEVSNA